jgi:hypothetical protein
MILRVACGKGNKERHVPLSPRLLTELLAFWVKYRPGKRPDRPYADTSIWPMKAVSMDEILEATAEYFDISAEEYVGFRRSALAVPPRIDLRKGV